MELVVADWNVNARRRFGTDHLGHLDASGARIALLQEVSEAPSNRCGLPVGPVTRLSTSSTRSTASATGTPPQTAPRSSSATVPR